MPQPDHSGATAFVTGGAQGLGHAISEALISDALVDFDQNLNGACGE